MRGGEDFDLVEAEADDGEGWVGGKEDDGGGGEEEEERGEGEAAAERAVVNVGAAVIEG